ncbi:hypothetical protein F0562_004422 [Nyssa sinensis]|uniref:Pre-rRNA-processing protein RIX1 N-terminal domain-containing protein n=1 Tax=Nyssa sinensis TaxID=561372 RepID=A0A5J5BXT0_9ASTE|nr:hypothetical protein F0562_004422 [Nyssa sinensis]
MLATPYPVEVTVPIDPLLAVIWRVLMVDGSLYQPLSPFTTVVQQQHTCNELSILHLYSLDLLAAVIKGVRRQLWPHTAEIVSLLTAYFRRSALAKLRIKVYSIIRILLISMGVGIALSIDQEVISNAFVDLEYNAYEKQRASSSANSIFEASWQPSHKKRKHVTTIGSLEEPVDEEGLDAVTKTNLTSPIPLKIAALKALEVLLTVGGALSSEYWRSSVDLSSTLHALLASLLSPTRVRPRYLFRGLELFHKGKQMTGTKIAEICAHALLALELHMHPRHLPVVDFPSPIHGSFNERFNCEVSENLCSTGQENDAQLSTPPGVDNSDGNDDSCSWVHNGNESDDPPSNRNENINTEEPSNADVQQTIKDFQAEILHMDGLSRVVVPEGSQHGQAVSADARMVSRHEIMVKPGQFQDPISIQSVEVQTGSSAGSDVELGKVVGDNSAFDPPTPSNILASCNDVLGDADDGSNMSKEIRKNLNI